LPRPPCCRRIAGRPAAAIFKPAGIPTRELEVVTMTLDEFESLRLADLEGLYHEAGAERMGVSRPTFGRILEVARRKVAEALTGGKALKIEGGPVLEAAQRRCSRCDARWTGPAGMCPRCRRARGPGCNPHPER
jgi:uncharacterized protein